ncbi:MAG: sigma-70 family RNA polymerase sigma factor [Bacteroidetes bacterium]|nr:sigma-70 family RNA polymerase sigma factor [Bacteroidota bacterium]
MAERNAYNPAHTGVQAPFGEGLQLLIAACLRQERSAQRKLYDQYADLVYGIIRRYEWDEVIAQDIHIEAFCRVFDRLAQYRFEGAFEGWLRRIAIHSIADYFRKHGPQNEPLHEAAQDLPQHYDLNGIHNLSYKELLKMIQELPDRQRTVFNLAVFDQYPHKEIGAMLGIPENNSRWYLNDARKRLKEKLAAINS